MKYDLKTIFELRKTKPLSCRVSVGRVFFQNGQMGLFDASWSLFPVKKRTDVSTGDVVVCELTFETDEFEISRILNHVPCKGPWTNAVIPDPLSTTAFGKSRFSLIKKRTQALQRTKQFFENRSFDNIETPTLVPSGGVETYLHSFSTQYQDHRGHNWPLQMPTSPEFALKKILTEGLSKVFQLSRAYRNAGELSPHHEPEFIMLEWYRTNATLGDMLNDTRKLVHTLAEFLGSELELPGSWQTFRVDELFADLLGLRLEQLQDRNDFYKKAKSKSISLVDTDDWDSIFCKLFMEKIEPFLEKQKACFVSHYPIQMGALAAQEPGKPFVERAEAFVCGVEICNAYLELVDADQLIARFDKTNALRRDVARDPVFENAMKFGLPPCAGNALGIDRLIALLLGQKEIATLYPIPFLSQFPKQTVASE